MLEGALRGKNIDSMTIGEMREAMVVLTSIILGMLLVSNKSAEEIKEAMK